MFSIIIWRKSSSRQTSTILGIENIENILPHIYPHTALQKMPPPSDKQLPNINNELNT